MHRDDLLKRISASQDAAGVAKALRLLDSISPRALEMWAPPAAPPQILNLADDGTATLRIYDVIGGGFFGGVSAEQVAQALTDAQGAKSLTVYVNSPGGDYFEGKAIRAQLKRFATTHEVVAVVDSLAASAAALLITGANRIEMGESSTLMVHMVRCGAWGTKGELRAMADVVEQEDGQVVDIFAASTGRPAAEVEALLNAETWMTAEAAIEAGFADCMEGCAEDAPEETPDPLAPAAALKGVSLQDSTRRLTAALTPERRGIDRMLAELRQEGLTAV